MIVPMVKMFAACRESDRDTLLRRLRALGVLHVVPVVEPEERDVDEGRDERRRRVEAALQVLRAYEPHGPRPTISATEAAEEVLASERKGEEARARLDALYREADRLRLWGDVRASALRDLREAGVELQALIVPERTVPELRARVVRRLQSLPQRRQLVAAIGVDPEALPPRVEVLPLPERDRADLLAEAAEIEARLAIRRQRLAEVAWLVSDLERESERLLEEEQWTRILESGLSEDRIFAVQGWVPADRVGVLRDELGDADASVALRISEPELDDRPPTLVRYRRWARPVDGLFRILRMVPGYREAEASSVFMIALPVFAGMIIGDAGYGLLFALAALLAGGFLARAMDPDLRTMLILFGLAALAWGAITGVWFGLTPTEIETSGGVMAPLGHALHSLQLMRGSESDTWMLLIKICFIFGAAHLITAHVRRVMDLRPDVRALAEVGWVVVLLAMLDVIWILFFGADGGLWPWLGPLAAGGLVLGLALVALFSEPDHPPVKRIGLGLAGSLLPLLGTFSDTLSYIRLMAVGLASFYLGSTFNVLAASLADATSWFFGALVLVAGHSLNIGLILIAIFAHGVRLNVLEFSSNAGIHWTGYPYRPFTERLAKERK